MNQRRLFELGLLSSKKFSSFQKKKKVLFLQLIKHVDRKENNMTHETEQKKNLLDTQAAYGKKNVFTQGAHES